VRKVTKESNVRDAYGKKNKLPPAPDFLVGLRITATSAGKSVHILPRPAFFSGPRAYLDFIKILESYELAVLWPIFIKSGIKIKSY